MKATGLANCYTLECSYSSGKRVNNISHKLNLKTGQKEGDCVMTDPRSKFYCENVFGQNPNGSLNKTR